MIKDITLENNTSETASSSSSNKSWSSLFRSSAAPTSAPVTQQQQNNNVQSQSKSGSKNKSLPVSNSHGHLNGTTTTTTTNSSNETLPVNETVVNTNSKISNNNNDSMLKMLGNVFKDCQLKHSAPALQPRGIRNRANWCYVNATMQALLACPPFYNLLKTCYAKVKSSSNANLALSGVPFLAALGRYICEFKTMVRNESSTTITNSKSNHAIQTHNGKELIVGEPFEIDYFYEVLASAKSEVTFKSGRQEDAQEFLSFLLNRLHDEMTKCLESLNSSNSNAQSSQNHQANDYSNTNGKVNGETSNHQSNSDDLNNDNDEWKEVGKKNRAYVTRKAEFKQSPLSDIFCGQFRSALSQPGVKDKESVSLEPFFTLPLEIQPDTIRNVNQALEHFVQKEELFGFTHQETKQEIEAFKRISFEDLPPVLIIYLKCFVYDKQGGIQKLLKRIEFSIDLEINKELISPAQRSKLKENKRKYKLFAVEYHHGDKANGGHYITDVYHPGVVGWVRYNDATVQSVNNAQVLKSDDKKLVPYLLYYRRADLI